MMSGTPKYGKTFFSALGRYTILYALLLGIGFVFFLPFLYLLSSSLHDIRGIFAVPFRWIPDPVRWQNFVEAVTVLPFHKFLLNTCLITVCNIFGTLFSSSLVAYGFSRLRFKGRDTLFLVCVSTMMLPGQVTMIPLYVLYSHLGWIDTFFPLIVPSFFGSPFFIFLLRQFFMTIPSELDEAAVLDGASHFRIYWNLILPLSKPALATVVIFTFIGSWNDFMGPLIYLNSPENATLTLGLSLLKNRLVTSGAMQWNLLMAASVLMLVPNVVIFFLAQKQFIKGILLTGLKG
jgi:ABC-type glycerol-3-phosphate transport system permease component